LPRLFPHTRFRHSPLASSLVPFPNYFIPKASVFRPSPHLSSHFPIISSQRLPSFAPRLITRPISQLFHPKGYRLSHLASSLVPFPHYFISKATFFRTSHNQLSNLTIILSHTRQSVCSFLMTMLI